MAQYCSVCGKANPDTAGNCDVCGTALRPAEAIHAGAAASSVQTVGASGQFNSAPAQGAYASADPMSGPICPKCRRTNRGHSAFCAYCGYRLITNGANGSSNGQPISEALQAQAYSAPSAIAAAPPTAQIIPDVSGNIPSGVILKRRYRILRKIAQGGMGAVYESVDVNEPSGRRWAVKEMSPASLPVGERTQAITDFRREAAILHGLKHDSLPEVLETFEEMNRHFLVMEFIAGRTLLNLVDMTPGFLPEERVMAWARQLFYVLHYLHSQPTPIIYRDVKPANVMLIEGTERIKLIDFGIARFHRPGKVQDTEAFGTAGYAPPEQYGKGQTDQRSDIYALGATLHHILTKQDPSLNPFNWVPARRMNPNVSPAIENALMVATSLDPARRYRNIEEFAQAVGIYLPGSYASSRPVMMGMSNPRPYTVSPTAGTLPIMVEPAPPTPSVAARPATPAAPSLTAAPASTPAKPKTSSSKKKAVSTASSALPAPKAQAQSTAAATPTPQVPIVSSTATGTVIESAELLYPTNTGMVDEKQIAVSPPAVIPAVTPATASKPAEKKAADSSKIVVPAQVVDLGEAKWNTRVAKKVPITTTGGAMRGMVLATQPWIAYNPQHFQGSAVTLDVRVKRRQLKFGRVELQVPNLFAIIWSRTRKVLPFFMVWFWLLVVVANAFNRTLLTVAAVVVGGLLVLEGLMWLWAQHVRLLVPAEKINTGRLMVKSSGGDSSIEVRVLARPSWVERTIGWSFALVLFVAEIMLVTWVALSLLGINMPFFG